MSELVRRKYNKRNTHVKFCVGAKLSFKTRNTRKNVRTISIPKVNTTLLPNISFGSNNIWRISDSANHNICWTG